MTEFLSGKILQNCIGGLKIDKNHSKFARYDLDGCAKAQNAMDAAKALIPVISDEWKKRSRRTLEPFETLMMEDAEFAIVAFGSCSGNAKLAVQRLRQQGEKVGMIRMHMLRPWPEQELHSILQNVSRIAVVDSQISLGSWSKLYQGIKSWYTGFASNFIAGDMLSVNDFTDIVRRLRSSSAPERVWMI
jgi:pyruvate ferredoxin oxidoreductase alpha subunit